MEILILLRVTIWFEWKGEVNRYWNKYRLTIKRKKEKEKEYRNKILAVGVRSRYDMPTVRTFYCWSRKQKPGYVSVSVKK